MGNWGLLPHGYNRPMLTSSHARRKILPSRSISLGKVENDYAGIKPRWHRPFKNAEFWLRGLFDLDLALGLKSNELLSS